MLRRLTELRVPPWSARTKLHAPSRPASGGRPGHGKTLPFLPEDWSTSAASSSPLSTRSRNRVRYKVGRVCVPVCGVCGVMRGAWGAGGPPVSSGLVRRRGLRVCLASRSFCLLPAAPVSVVSESAVASLFSVRFFPYPLVSVRLCADVCGCVVCSSASHWVGACGLRPESEIVCCAVYLMMIAWRVALAVPASVLGFRILTPLRSGPL